MSELLNGFNNGRDTTDGIGGQKPIDQIANGINASDSGSLFYQKVEKMVDEWKAINLGEITPYSPEAEIDAGFKSFMLWLKKNDNDL